MGGREVVVVGFLVWCIKWQEFYRRESWAVGREGRLRNRTRWGYAEGLSCLFPYAVCGEG